MRDGFLNDTIWPRGEEDMRKISNRESLREYNKSHIRTQYRPGDTVWVIDTYIVGTVLRVKNPTGRNPEALIDFYWQKLVPTTRWIPFRSLQLLSAPNPNLQEDDMHELKGCVPDIPSVPPIPPSDIGDVLCLIVPDRNNPSKTYQIYIGEFLGPPIVLAAMQRNKVGKFRLADHRITYWPHPSMTQPATAREEIEYWKERTKGEEIT